jgi:FimV-like protein
MHLTHSDFIIYGFFILISALILLVLLKSLKTAKPPAPNKSMQQTAFDFSKVDMTAIAGDDIFATQLDLAKAYIEMDQSAAAKKILKKCLSSASSEQMSTVTALLETL